MSGDSGSSSQSNGSSSKGYKTPVARVGDNRVGKVVNEDVENGRNSFVISYSICFAYKSGRGGWVMKIVMPRVFMVAVLHTFRLLEQQPSVSRIVYR